MAFRTILGMDFEEHPDVWAAMVRVTPRLAERLLERNVDNPRRIMPTVVGRYADQMMRDAWLPVAEGIGIDTAGRMFNGQHRLKAIVSSGKSVWLLAVVHLPPLAVKVTDRGKMRSIVDAMRIVGICGNAKVVQVARWYAGISHSGFRSGGSPSDAEVERVLLEHMYSIEAVQQHDHGINVVSRVPVRAAVMLAYETHGDIALEFYDRLQDGLGLFEDDPVRRLRNHWQRYAVKGGGSAAQAEQYQRTIWAFNRWIVGSPARAVGAETEIIDRAAAARKEE